MIPPEAIRESFIAGSGPGGQNVNKVATAVQLRVELARLGLHPDVYRRLKALAGSKVALGGVLVITARRFRTQEANRRDARARLDELLARAREWPEKRVATRPSRAAKAERVEAKKKRGGIKAGRGRVEVD